ncbi:MAG: DUF2865 domain-containing protein [Rhizobiaceae bacterium]
MPRSVFGHAFATALLATVAVAVPDLADAAPGSRVCRQIEAQLSGGGGRPGKWSSAVAQQRAEIAKVRRQMRAAGCGFFNSDRTCRSLSGAASRMERNLSSLQRGQARQEGGGRSRSQLIAALEANNCRGERRVAVAQRQPGLLERLFGGDRRIDSDEDAVSNVVGGDTTNVRRRHDSGRSPVITPGFDSSRYRTFCVRTCDGYYFPMSPASNRSDFARDAQNCQTACPGADVEVYYHKADKEEAADMRSAISGRLYSDMTTAFLYRSDTAPQGNSCSCASKPQGFTVIAGESKDIETKVVGIERTEVAVPAMPLPRSRPDPGADPETLLNRDGNFGADEIRKLLSDDDDPATAGRKIRVVGPVFLPDPAGAIDLRAPAQTEVR